MRLSRFPRGVQDWIGKGSFLTLLRPCRNVGCLVLFHPPVSCDNLIASDRVGLRITEAMLSVAVFHGIHSLPHGAPCFLISGSGRYTRFPHSAAPSDFRGFPNSPTNGPLQMSCRWSYNCAERYVCWEIISPCPRNKALFPVMSVSIGNSILR